MRLPALLAPVLDCGEIASIDGLWSAKTKTVVDRLEHFSYIDLALALPRLCSLHRSSDTIAPGSGPAGLNFPPKQPALATGENGLRKWRKFKKAPDSIASSVFSGHAEISGNSPLHERDPVRVQPVKTTVQSD